MVTNAKLKEREIKRFLLLTTVLFILSPCFLKNAKSGELADLKFIVKHGSDSTQERVVKEDNFSWRTTSEIKLFAMGAIRLYQIFVSSQQAQVGIFTPSCSHFGMRAIKKRGFFWGGLMTADRLLRCNGLSRSYYEIDPKTNRAIDPVDDHILKWRKSNKQCEK